MCWRIQAPVRLAFSQVVLAQLSPEMRPGGTPSSRRRWAVAGVSLETYICCTRPWGWGMGRRHLAVEPVAEPPVVSGL